MSHKNILSERITFCNVRMSNAMELKKWSKARVEFACNKDGNKTELSCYSKERTSKAVGMEIKKEIKTFVFILLFYQ